MPTSTCCLDVSGSSSASSAILSADFIRPGLPTPWSGHTNALYHNTYETIEPHSGISQAMFNIVSNSNIVSFDNIDIGSSETISLAETQVVLNKCLRECHDGVGGFEADGERGVGVGGCVRGVGVGGFWDKSQGGASGGKGEESNDQHGGNVWRF